MTSDGKWSIYYVYIVHACDNELAIHDIVSSGVSLTHSTSYSLASTSQPPEVSGDSPADSSDVSAAIVLSNGQATSEVGIQTVSFKVQYRGGPLSPLCSKNPPLESKYKFFVFDKNSKTVCSGRDQGCMCPPPP